MTPKSDVPSNPECTKRSPSSMFAVAAVLVYVAVLPFTHNAALKNLAIVMMGISTGWSAYRREWRLDVRSPITLAIIGVVCASLVSSVVSPTLVENLYAMRNHFVPTLLLLILVPSYFRTEFRARMLMAVVVSAFAVRLGLTIVELVQLADMSRGRAEGEYIKGFMLEATMYLPIAAGLLFFVAGYWRVFIAGILLVGLAALLYMEGRTPLVASLVGILAVPFVLRRFRYVAGTAAIAVAVSSGIFVLQPNLAARFGSIFQSSTYTGAEGMSLRYPIWVGTLEIVTDHPLLGYGFGWKKLGRVATEGGYVARWREATDQLSHLKVEYFSLPTDKVNPHNLWIQIAFEGGSIGVLMYALMLAVLLSQAVVCTRRLPPALQPISAACIGMLGAHIVVNAANGLWMGTGPTLAMIALLEMCRQTNAIVRP